MLSHCFNKIYVFSVCVVGHVVCFVCIHFFRPSTFTILFCRFWSKPFNFRKQITASELDTLLHSWSRPLSVLILFCYRYPVCTVYLFFSHYHGLMWITVQVRHARVFNPIVSICLLAQKFRNSDINSYSFFIHDLNLFQMLIGVS